MAVDWYRFLLKCSAYATHLYGAVAAVISWFLL